VIVNIRAFLEVFLTLLFQYIGKPRVITPVHFYDLALLRLCYPKAIMRSGVLVLRVPRYPYLRVILSHCRDKLLPSSLSNGLCLIHPAQKNTGLRLNAIEVPAQTGKDISDTPIPRSDVSLAYLVVIHETRNRPYSRLDLFHRGFIKRV
jgi:hypothetical protein